MFEYDLSILGEPDTVPIRPQIGVITDSPGNMNKNGNPNVKMLSMGCVICKMKTSVSMNSDVRAIAKPKNHKLRVSNLGAVP